MKSGEGKNTERERQDRNRQIRINATRKLEQLITLALDSGFAGSVSIEVNAKAGDLGRIKSTIIDHS